MKKSTHKLTFIATLSFALLSFTSIQGLWIIPSTSKANFTIDGMLGIDCNGTLDFTSSEIAFDPAKPETGNMKVVLSVATINTNSAKRDKHLKTDDFFDEAQYPTISFTSTTIQKSVTGYTVNGNLKIKNVTKVVAIPFTFSPNGTSGVFKADFRINRMDFKVGEKEKMIGKEVMISLNIPVNAK